MNSDGEFEFIYHDPDEALGGHSLVPRGGAPVGIPRVLVVIRFRTSGGPEFFQDRRLKVGQREGVRSKALAKAV